VLALGLAMVLLLRGSGSAQDTGTPQEHAAQRPAPRELSPEQIVARSEKAVALIRTGRGFGTGFLIRPGILATNSHVIDGSPVDQLKVFFPSAPDSTKEPFRPAALIYEDRQRDLALLKLDAAHTPLPMAEDYAFRRGQGITIIGNPGTAKGAVTLQNAVSQGVLSTTTQLEGQDFYQLSVAINRGNSGGPVLDSTGSVIGVVTLKSVKEEGMAFCVPWKDLRDALVRAERRTPEEINQATSLHDTQALFIRVAQAGLLYGVSMEFFCISIREAVRGGARPDAGVAAARRVIDERLKAEERILLDDITAKLSSIGSDSRIDANVRTKLVELWGVYREMKGYIDNPRGNVESYEGKTRELGDRLKRLINELSLLLGLEVKI
jgi:serine protease Do